MGIATIATVIVALVNLPGTGSQIAFGSVSLSAIQRIIPHATNANVVALAQALNNNIGKYDAMRTAVNQFFTQKKFGTPNPKTLSLYDNSSYSQAKLISLVNNRQAITLWWVTLKAGITKLYNSTIATTYQNLYAYYDSKNRNSYDYTIVYWMLTVLMKEPNEDKMNNVSDLIGNSMEAQLNKTPALAFLIYTDAFELNHNQTYMKGVW